MDIKFMFISLIFIVATAIFIGCGNNKCEGDVFGNNVNLIVPINTLPSLDTFNIGDTLWVEADIDKYVEVEGKSERIFLDSFNFFTKLIISEISDSTENFLVDFQLVEEVGEVEILPLPTLLTYPMIFEETEVAYRFRAGLIFNDSGRYYFNFSTSAEIFENYEHPALYYCEDRRRNEVDVIYTNISTNQEDYENIFLETGVDYLIQVMDYPRYASIGAHTFIVRE